MTIMLKNADYTTLEAIKNLQKMRQKLDLPRNKAVFERLKDK